MFFSSNSQAYCIIYQQRLLIITISSYNNYTDRLRKPAAGGSMRMTKAKSWRGSMDVTSHEKIVRDAVETATAPSETDATQLPPEYRLHLVILGDASSGKTELMHTLTTPVTSKRMSRLPSFLAASRRNSSAKDRSTDQAPPSVLEEYTSSEFDVVNISTSDRSIPTAGSTNSSLTSSNDGGSFVGASPEISEDYVTWSSSSSSTSSTSSLFTSAEDEIVATQNRGGQRSSRLESNRRVSFREKVKSKKMSGEVEIGEISDREDLSGSKGKKDKRKDRTEKEKEKDEDWEKDKDKDKEKEKEKERERRRQNKRESQEKSRDKKEKKKDKSSSKKRSSKKDSGEKDKEREKDKEKEREKEKEKDSKNKDKPVWPRNKSERIREGGGGSSGDEGGAGTTPSKSVAATGVHIYNLPIKGIAQLSVTAFDFLPNVR